MFPDRDLQAPRRSCVLVVSREQEALAGQSGIPRVSDSTTRVRSV